MQQSANEHAALIWIRSSNTMRARGTTTAAPEAGYMSAPGDAPKSALKIPLAQGAVIHVAQVTLAQNRHHHSAHQPPWRHLVIAEAPGLAAYAEAGGQA